MAPSTEWGISASEKQAELQRSQIRARIRNDYQRKINNPAFKESLIDPAYFRWNYARHNSYNYFKATKLTSIAGAIMGVAIPVGLIYFFYRHRKYTEEMYESGKWKKPRNLVNG
ncbi:NADH dehydrogenase [ubiquinone] 1 beta subcomplex subunit 4-like isoform X1 [Lytechinus pictus]|uniref:NADH dehydrogenase [ubiquinone] 1 beta subcomplex subunit 4-like n=1 Tax=Lytechinus variegatus TaxID=7654 RepID=UPI001BB111B4|nr:NADH dehydrogenase [ubiquinone] 1 beta subcomplex subunit 4-like [Lytechinus variegatus]